MIITADLLRAATGCTPERAAFAAPGLDAACKLYGIDTVPRLAAFLGQLAVESGRFAYVREIASGAGYEGRKDLGNTEPGDGPRYRGRGWIQVTGRGNYREVTQRMQGKLSLMRVPDFEAEPEELEKPTWAALASADWWTAHNLNALADLSANDPSQIDRISRAINRGNPDSDRPANHETERRTAWLLALNALRTIESKDHTPADRVESTPTEWDLQNPPQPKGSTMPPFVIPAVVELAKLIPRLGTMFGGSEVAQRNVAAAGVVVDAVVGAVGAANAQEAVEKVQSDPSSREAATKAVEGVWYQIAEAGGGGIEGARKADALISDRRDMLYSPSFWVAMPLLAIVMMIVGAVVGLWGQPFSEDVRSAIANGIPMLILGGLIGYYYGQTTSRNRTTAAGGQQ